MHACVQCECASGMFVCVCLRVCVRKNVPIPKVSLQSASAVPVHHSCMCSVVLLYECGASCCMFKCVCKEECE